VTLFAFQTTQDTHLSETVFNTSWFGLSASLHSKYESKPRRGEHDECFWEFSVRWDWGQA
jgi:hypothetical protein